MLLWFYLSLPGRFSPARGGRTPGTGRVSGQTAAATRIIYLFMKRPRCVASLRGWMAELGIYGWVPLSPPLLPSIPVLPINPSGGPQAALCTFWGGFCFFTPGFWVFFFSPGLLEVLESSSPGVVGPVHPPGWMDGNVPGLFCLCGSSNIHLFVVIPRGSPVLKGGLCRRIIEKMLVKQNLGDGGKKIQVFPPKNLQLGFAIPGSPPALLEWWFGVRHSLARTP